MTLQEKLDAMNTKDTTIFCGSHRYGTKFFCDIEYEKNGEQFKFREESVTSLEDAVSAVHTKFVKLTKTNFKEAIPAQLTFEKGSSEVNETPPNSMRNLDDEVPF